MKNGANRKANGKSRKALILYFRETEWNGIKLDGKDSHRRPYLIQTERNETQRYETERNETNGTNETKWNGTEWNGTKKHRNGTERNGTEWNETEQRKKFIET